MLLIVLPILWADFAPAESVAAAPISAAAILPLVVAAAFDCVAAAVSILFPPRKPQLVSVLVLTPLLPSVRTYKKL